MSKSPSSKPAISSVQAASLEVIIVVHPSSETVTQKVEGVKMLACSTGTYSANSSLTPTVQIRWVRLWKHGNFHYHCDCLMSPDGTSQVPTSLQTWHDVSFIREDVLRTKQPESLVVWKRQELKTGIWMHEEMDRYFYNRHIVRVIFLIKVQFVLSDNGRPDLEQIRGHCGYLKESKKF